MRKQVLNQAPRSRSLIKSGAQYLTLLGVIAGTGAVAYAQAQPDSTESVPSAEELLQLPPAAPAAPDIVVEPAAVPEALAAPAQDLLAAPSAPVDASTYIDPSSDYSLGATAPTRVVLDERSTGCQTVVDGGTVGSSSCAAIASAYSADGPSRTVVGPGGQLTTVSVGPISFNSRGMKWNPDFSVQNFLNLTPRPSGLLGNGDVDLLFPLTIPAPISSLFGWRVHPIYGDTRLHTGTDISAPMGTPVVAAFTGKVVTADFMQGYGITVVLEHDNGTRQTLYGHMSEIFVEAGDEVKQGDVIGRVGSTGNSTGPHLHFEVRELTSTGWVAVSPNEALEIALKHFSSDFQVAAAAKSSKNEAVTTLVQFGRFASKASLKDVAKPIPGMDGESGEKAVDALPIVDVNALSK